MLVSFTSCCQIRQRDVGWRIVLLIAGLAALIWFFDPQRAIQSNEPGVIEINYTGDAAAWALSARSPTSRTWHRLRIFVEKEGRRYEAARALPVGDYDWVLDTLAGARAGGSPTKVKTWTLLKPVGRPGSTPPATTRPNELTVTLELQRTNQLGAWLAKITRNYRLTFDQIPFWRYVGTSLFLVILNLVGTLFSCSLVA
ncbi:MAG TPA: hypothetical protein VH207_03925 [Chthoniobacterales bacterium]|jgi:ABC-type glycerol-3-phosphate transport system permease component|nr:hypothetical protein [Chthoniobacterales bacterium]